VRQKSCGLACTRTKKAQKGAFSDRAVGLVWLKVSHFIWASCFSCFSRCPYTDGTTLHSTSKIRSCTPSSHHHRPTSESVSILTNHVGFRRALDDNFERLHPLTIYHPNHTSRALQPPSQLYYNISSSIRPDFSS
jgi:hypothetical protein